MANRRPTDLIKPVPPEDRGPPARPTEDWRFMRAPGDTPGPTDSGLRRYGAWIVGSILLVVFLAFAGVVWLAYRDGVGADGEVPLIRADARPFKVSPDDPGGLEVPNQRLSVNVLLGTEPSTDAPEPAARPVPAEPEVARVPPPPPPPPAPRREETQPTPAEEQPEATTGRAEAPTPEPEPPVTVFRTVPAPPTTAVVRPAPAPAQQPERPIALLAAATEAAGGATAGGRVYHIQLAAIRDEARARQAQNELWGAYQEVLGGLEPRIERAEIGDALFFRIQAGPFESRDAANQVCDRLRARQAACIVVSG